MSIQSLWQIIKGNTSTPYFIFSYKRDTQYTFKTYIKDDYEVLSSACITILMPIKSVCKTVQVTE
jgi:hypothetical protein